MALHKRSDDLPEEFAVTIFDAMILYYNTMRATQLGGWTDADQSIASFIRKAKKHAIQIKRADLEAMLACCVQNAELRSEDGYFWHPTRKGLKGFIQELARHKSTEKFYYDTYYNFFTSTALRKSGAGIIELPEEPNKG